MAVENTKKGGSFLIEETAPADVFTPEDFSEEQRMFAKTAEDFVQNEVIPNIERTEAQEEGAMVALLKKAGELGLLMIDVPEKYDGLGLDKATSMLVSEVISKGAAFATTMGVHTGIGTLPLVYFGTEEQKQKYLPKLATAELMGCYSLTEAGSGSDALAAQARAELTPDGKHYILNGEKMFVTNGGFSDIFFVFAKIGGKDFSCFLVERDFKGVSTGAEEKKLGIKGSSTVTLILEDVQVPVENLVGEAGKGHKIAFNILNIGRFKLGVGGVGAAKIAFDEAVKYSKERHQFGRPICSFGLIKNKIANIAAGIYATESMSYRTAGLIDNVLAGLDKNADDAAARTLAGIEEYAIECSIMKVKGSEMLESTTYDTVQMLGGYGYMQDYSMERYYRDARITSIYEGTNEINRLVIPGMIIKRAIKGDLALMAAAKKLQAEILEFPMLEESDDDGLLAEEIKMVAGAKKIALLAAGTSFQKFTDKVGEKQGILGNLADIIIEAFGMESALLRTLKIASSKGDEAAAVPAKLTRLYIYNAMGRIELWAKEVLGSSAAGDELRTLLAALRRFTRHKPVDTLELRLEIADDFIEKEKYEI